MKSNRDVKKRKLALELHSINDMMMGCNLGNFPC